MARFSGAAVVGLALAGCSSVPDAANPVEWYKGARDMVVGSDEAGKPVTDGEAQNSLVADRDKPPPGADEPIPNLNTVPARPVVSSARERHEVAQALVADRRQAREYSGEVIRRQGEIPPPSRPEGQAAASQAGAPAAASAPMPSDRPAEPSPSGASPEQVATASPPSPPSEPGRPELPPALRGEPPAQPAARAAPPARPAPRQQVAREPESERAPTAAPESVTRRSDQPIGLPNIVIPAENPEAPQLAEVRPYVPPPGLDEQETVVVGGNGSSGQVAATSYRQLPAPGSVATEVPGTRPLSAFSTAGTRGSYQAATIQFAFGSARLSERDRTILRQVATEHKRVGGTLRVVGHASSRTNARDLAKHKMANLAISTERAEVVARELTRHGVAAGDMFVGAVSDADPKFFEFMPTGEAGNRRTEIFIDF